jgi:hypothetical protein
VRALKHASKALTEVASTNMRLAKQVNENTIKTGEFYNTITPSLWTSVEGRIQLGKLHRNVVNLQDTSKEIKDLITQATDSLEKNNTDFTQNNLDLTTQVAANTSMCAASACMLFGAVGVFITLYFAIVTYNEIKYTGRHVGDMREILKNTQIQVEECHLGLQKIEHRTLQMASDLRMQLQESRGLVGEIMSTHDQSSTGYIISTTVVVFLIVKALKVIRVI